VKILIDILHPAHVHFFKGFIRQSSSWCEPVVVTRNKEITDRLLKAEGIPFRKLSDPATGLFGQARELASRWLQIFEIIRREKCSLAMSISGLCTALPAKLLSVPNIAFTDTEDASLSNKIAFPFSDLIVTPTFFLNDLGARHRRYFGLHELAYLKSADEADMKEIRSQCNLPERYVILRLVAHKALHDFGVSAVPRDRLREFIGILDRYGRVLLSSEEPLPVDLLDRQLSIPIERIHAVLGGAQLFVGESPTMAVESSLLGVPAYLITSRWQRLGNMVGLEKEHNLLKNFSDFEDLLAALPEPSSLIETQSSWMSRARAFRQDADDVTDVITRSIKSLL
jgi:predicted glycosyltransferase